jgi:hypothetical protein
MDSIYDILKQKEHVCKKIVKKYLTKNELWTFEWAKMNHIFISPCHNHFCVNLNFSFLNMYIKNVFRMVIFRIGFVVH